MNIDDPGAVLGATALSPAALAARGLTRHHVRRAVAEGALVRVRKGRYLTPDCPQPLIDAARLGGRLGCVSLLALLGVFVRERRGALHVHIDAGASRLPRRDNTVLAHWHRSSADPARLTAPLIEAIAQACRCQAPRDAVATIDSAWHLGFIDEAGVAEVFRLLPRRFAPLRPLLDRRSEAGTESLVRLLVRVMGHSVEVQVPIDGVGRVDLVVDGWLIIECDSRAHHSTWEDRKRDIRRDLAAAALGYTTIRLLAEDVLGDQDRVVQLVRDALRHGLGRTPPISRRRPRERSKQP